MKNRNKKLIKINGTNKNNENNYHENNGKANNRKPVRYRVKCNNQQCF